MIRPDKDDAALLRRLKAMPEHSEPKPMRVQIPAYTDRWMMGDRYGEVVKITKGLVHRVAHVKLDKSGKTLRFILDDCTPV